MRTARRSRLFVGRGRGKGPSPKHSNCWKESFSHLSTNSDVDRTENSNGLRSHAKVKAVLFLHSAWNSHQPVFTFFFYQNLKCLKCSWGYRTKPNGTLYKVCCGGGRGGRALKFYAELVELGICIVILAAPTHPWETPLTCSSAPPSPIPAHSLNHS